MSACCNKLLQDVNRLVTNSILQQKLSLKFEAAKIRWESISSLKSLCSTKTSKILGHFAWRTIHFEGLLMFERERERLGVWVGDWEKERLGVLAVYLKVYEQNLTFAAKTLRRKVHHQARNVEFCSSSLQFVGKDRSLYFCVNQTLYPNSSNKQ